MALRVARGLFRLWLVLSVLWIGGVGVVTWAGMNNIAAAGGRMTNWSPIRRHQKNRLGIFQTLTPPSHTEYFETWNAV